MKVFTCDKCGDEFPSPIEERNVKDIHGNWKVYDFCAPCKNELEAKTDEAILEYIEE